MRVIRLLLLCLLIVGFPAIVAAQAQTVRVLVNDAPPYRILGSANGERTYAGLYVDILRLVAAELKLELQFIEQPFARALLVMQNGEADIMLGPNRTAAREVYLHYLEPPLPEEPKVFLQRREAPPIRAYDDLAGKRIAVLRGATYFDRFDLDAGLTKIPLDDYAAGLRLVALGRLDTVVMPELQARWMLRDSGYPLQLASYRAPGRPSYIALARASPLVARVPELTAALRRLMQNGSIARIVKRYE